MQATSNSTLFQTSHSQALGSYRAQKALFTSGLTASSSSSSSGSASRSTEAARFGYPIHLNPKFKQIVTSSADDLAVEGSGADGGRYRVLALKVEDGYVWTAEAGGLVRQIGFETGKTVNVYKGARGPVTSFAFLPAEQEGGAKVLVTGSWDRALRLYTISHKADDKDAQSPIKTIEGAMADFIKSVHTFTSSSATYVATGGSDKSIMIWMRTADGSLRCVNQNKSHTRPVNSLSSLTLLDGTTRLYSADSMGRILEHSLNPSTQRLETMREIQGFSTAVYEIRTGFRREEVDGEPATSGGTDAFLGAVQEDEQGTRFRLVAELWGASGDKSVKGFKLSPLLSPKTPPPSKARSGGQPVLGTQEPLTSSYCTLPHGDFVKTVLPLPLYLPASYAEFDAFSNAIVSGGSDEHIHLHLDTSESTNKQIEAHWHDVTALALYPRHPPSSPSPTSLPEAKAGEVWLVSASLDGSVRRWNLTALASLPEPQMKVVKDTAAVGEVEWAEHSVPPPVSRKMRREDDVIGMTAEEEAELAELMGSDDNE